MSNNCSRDSRLQKKNKSSRNKVACFLNQITFTVYTEHIALIETSVFDKNFRLLIEQDFIDPNTFML